MILEGDQLSDSGLSIGFKQDQRMTKICDLVLDADSAATFTNAVQQHYWYQMYIDELPIRGMLGEYMMAELAIDPKDGGGSMLKEQGFLYMHKEFSISYNGQQIIEVNLTSENPRPILPGTVGALTFSVTWVETSKSFVNRFDRYLEFAFMEHQIHWFSILNSFMMVVLLCGLVALILMRTLKNDYARYTSAEGDSLEMDLDRITEDSGWKVCHGDVFRAPKYLLFYASLIGSGHQLICLALCGITLTMFATMYDERGSAMTAFLVCYSLTSVVAGYSGAAFYKQNHGVEWKKCMLATAVLYPGICFGIAFLLNFIAVYYQSFAAFSFQTMFLMLVIWLCVSCPLVLVGTIMGRSTAVAGDFPCRVNALKRPIPEGKWYTQPLYLGLMSGVLPFGSIFIGQHSHSECTQCRLDRLRRSIAHHLIPHLSRLCVLVRDVLRVHFFLELQVLLRVRLHVPRLPDPDRGDRLRHHPLDLRPPQRRELPLALDGRREWRQHRTLRLPLRDLLLLREDEDVRRDADRVLLRLHGHVLDRPLHAHRHHRIHRRKHLRQTNLSVHQE